MEDRTCSIEDCQRKRKSRGWCQTHYVRWLRHGDPSVRLTMAFGDHCKVEGCPNPPHARNFCDKHYAKLRKYGDPESTRQVSYKGVTCLADNCDRGAKIRGMCKKHYGRWQIHGDPNITLKRLDHGETCEVHGCDRSYETMGCCNMHYQRIKNHGSTDKPVSQITPMGRFMAKVDRTDKGHGTECWLWTATTSANGYGRFVERRGKNVTAHRWGYEQLVGEIPDGLTLDHLCRVKSCVNPEHMEPVTRAENSRRALILRPKKTHCLRGHEFTEENTGIWVNKEGGVTRRCRACEKIRHAKRHAEKMRNRS